MTIPRPRGYWTKETIRFQLLKRLEEGKSIKRKDVVADDNKLHRAIRRVYGSWEEAVKLIDLDREDVFTYNKRSPESVKEELLKRKENGLSLHIRDIEEEDIALRRNMIRYFETTHKAYEAIGEDPLKYMSKPERLNNRMAQEDS